MTQTNVNKDVFKSNKERIYKPLDNFLNELEGGGVTVAYRMFNGECIALFPNIRADHKGNIQSYMHIGQHGAADPDILNSRKATPNEYKDLHNELINQVGYNIKVLV